MYTTIAFCYSGVNIQNIQGALEGWLFGTPYDREIAKGRCLELASAEDIIDNAISVQLLSARDDCITIYNVDHSSLNVHISMFNGSLPDLIKRCNDLNKKVTQFFKRIRAKNEGTGDFEIKTLARGIPVKVAESKKKGLTDHLQRPAEPDVIYGTLYDLLIRFILILAVSVIFSAASTVFGLLFPPTWLIPQVIIVILIVALVGSVLFAVLGSFIIEFFKALILWRSNKRRIYV